MVDLWDVFFFRPKKLCVLYIVSCRIQLYPSHNRGLYERTFEDSRKENAVFTKKNGKIGRVQDLWSSGTKMNCSVRSTEYWFHSFLGTCK